MSCLCVLLGIKIYILCISNYDQIDRVNQKLRKSAYENGISLSFIGESSYVTNIRREHFETFA